MVATIGDAGEISRPRCSKCQRNLAAKKYDKRGWTGGYRDCCTTCTRGYSKSSSRFWTLHKKDYCENKECTATIVIPDQLTVDHKDGNKKNNEPDNLVTLCHNCHSLKTHTNRDFVVLALREYDKLG